MGGAWGRPLLPGGFRSRCCEVGGQTAPSVELQACTGGVDLEQGQVILAIGGPERKVSVVLFLISCCFLSFLFKVFISVIFLPLAF